MQWRLSLSLCLSLTSEWLMVLTLSSHLVTVVCRHRASNLSTFPYTALILRNATPASDFGSGVPFLMFPWTSVRSRNNSFSSVYHSWKQIKHLIRQSIDYSIFLLGVSFLFCFFNKVIWYQLTANISQSQKNVLNNINTLIVTEKKINENCKKLNFFTNQVFLLTNPIAT